MGISWVQILVVAVLLVLLFGRGRISSLMGDVARGVTSFRQGLREGVEETAKDDDAEKQVGQTIEGEAVNKSTNSSENKK
ncbi:MAG: twin-arginine translocase TatA/TatE family subunit [PS1 clade bacterium]|uniref:Sec-independent protein translocase protein TatA n=1 Tax=PS1 clade bacterium TaxID=2175152 RepID=A0A937L6Y9_9PROT|nr:twin-arginine translocase TatA/TatE family subunit [PS1 clade bacterium]